MEVQVQRVHRGREGSLSFVIMKELHVRLLYMHNYLNHLQSEQAAVAVREHTGERLPLLGPRGTGSCVCN